MSISANLVPTGYIFIGATYSTGLIAANSGLQLTTIYPASGATGSQTLYVQYYNPTSIGANLSITTKIIMAKTDLVDM